MTTNITSKALSWAGISILTAGLIAGGTVVIEAVLFRIQEAKAAAEAAKAETEKAKAQWLDAQNKLLASVEARLGAEGAALAMANGLRDVARTQTDGQVRVGYETVRAENTQFDHFVEPLLTGPTKRMSELNEQIVKLKRELERSNYPNPSLGLFPPNVSQKTAQKLILEEELATLKETTTKNWSDAGGIVMGAANGLFGGTGGLYPTGNEPKPVRRILQEP